MWAVNASRVRQAASWIGVFLFSVIILSTGFVVVRQSLAIGLGWLAIPAVSLAVGVIAFASYKTMAPAPPDETPEAKRSRSRWIIGANLFASVVVIAGILSALGPLSTPKPRILKEIEGRWGRPGCRIVFRFTVRDRALIIDYERPASGDRRSRSIATIVTAEGDELSTRGDYPRAERPSNATFIYSTNGVTEGLTWDDNVRDLPLGLVPCPEMPQP